MNLTDDLDKIIGFLIWKQPFYGSLLQKARILEHEEEEWNTLSLPEWSSEMYAFVDLRGYIHVRKKKFSELSFAEKVHTLQHCVLHIVFEHVNRGRDKNRILWNIVCDGVVNSIMQSCPITKNGLPEDWITLADIKTLFGLPGQLSKMSDIEIYHLAEEYLKNMYDALSGEGYAGCEIERYIERKGKFGKFCKNFPDLFDETVDEGMIVHGGADFNDGNTKEIREGWKRALVQAYEAAKRAGVLPAGIEAMVNYLIKPELDMRALIRNTIKEGIGSGIRSTYRRLSRKMPGVFPGHKRYSIPTIWMLVDTSGSMSKHELAIGLGAVQDLSHLAKVKIICWDAEAYETIELRRGQDVVKRVGMKMVGGGGTVILPVLKKVYEEMNLMDIVIVFTDSEIYDLTQPGTIKMLDRVASMASKAIVLTTERETEKWPSDKWIVIAV